MDTPLRHPAAVLLAVCIALTAACPVVATTAPATDRVLRTDRARSYVDVDVRATLDSFTGRLERYEAQLTVDSAGRLKGAEVRFRFSDLKTGKPDRDARMLEWLGGGDPAGSFSLGVLALAPDGQGQANGRLTFHGVTERVEFPVLVRREGDTHTVTGTVTVDYRRWGLKILRHLGVRKVDPEVRVRFQIVASPPVPSAD